MTRRTPARPEPESTGATLGAQSDAWRISLHGGHSSDFCDHGSSPLADIVAEAARQGFRTYGVTEHAPRTDVRYLYPKEREQGMTPEDIQQRFDDYARALPPLQHQYAARMEILRGFEAEVVPPGSWDQTMDDLRRRYDFDYVVGSVHWVDEDLILSSRRAPFDRALDRLGGLEPLLLRYYDEVAQMIERLAPDVVGHLDVITRHGHKEGPVDTPSVRHAVGSVLEAARTHDSIIDVNLGALRRGLPHPYPAPWIIALARDMGLSFAFGDDSHSVADVGAGIDLAREWLLELKVHSVTTLTRRGGGPLRREEIALR